MVASVPRIIKLAAKSKWLRLLGWSLRRQITGVVGTSAFRQRHLPKLFGPCYATKAPIRKKDPSRIPFAQNEILICEERPHFCLIAIFRVPQQIVCNIGDK